MYVYYYMYICILYYALCIFCIYVYHVYLLHTYYNMHMYIQGTESYKLLTTVASFSGSSIYIYIYISPL